LAEPRENELEQQQAELTGEYLSLRAEAGEDAKAKRKLSQLQQKLDGLYWKKVESLLESRVSSDRDELNFSDEERLLIDVGLLDVALVENAAENLPQTLVEELNQPGPLNHFYLSEWLEDRYRRYRLTEDVTAADKESEQQQASKLQQARLAVLAKLKALFVGLPGITQELSALLTSGKLDEQILALDVALLSNRKLRRGFRQRKRLILMRGQILLKARARTRDAAALKMFDLLEEIFVRDWRERYAARGKNKQKSSTTELKATVSRDKAVDYLLSELRFVKTLLPVGALAGGVARTCAVMFAEGPRVTMADTSRGFALAQACDREYTVDPVVLVAPFRGRGIFEWDRDSLVVSLHPVENPLDSVANAAGNYHMLIDSFQNEGKLRKSYEAAFPGENFQQSFQSDFRAWVTKVGRGETGGMDAARRDFFRENIGPNVDGVLAPATLRNLGPQARQMFRKRLEKQVSLSGDDGNLRHRLAVLHWQDENLDKALAEMAAAAKLLPGNGAVLFSLGRLLEEKGDRDKAAGMFQICAKKAADSIWKLYAEEKVRSLSRK